MAKDLITGIGLSGDFVEWSTLRPGKNGLELLADGRLPVAELREAVAGERLAETGFPVAAEAGNVVLGLPSDKLLLRVLQLPAVDDEEDLAGMVELQVDKFSPFPIDQMVVSYEIISRTDEEITLLAVAARESDIESAAQLLAECGIDKIKRVDALLPGRWKNLIEAGVLGSGFETLVLLNDGVVEILVHKDGELRAVSCPGRIEDVEDAGIAREVAGDIANLLPTLDAAAWGASDGTLALCGDDSADVFAEALAEACGRKVRRISSDDLPRASYGTAARQEAGGTTLDLTLPSWRAAEMGQRAKRRLTLLALGVLGVWALVVGGVLGWIQYEKYMLGRLKAEDERLAAPANKVRHLRLQAGMVERYTDRTYSALECLREISRVQPQGVDLTSFTYRKGEGVTIDGEADTGPLVNRFNEALNKSKLFAEVKPGPRTLTRKGRHRFSFAIKFPEVRP